MPRNCLTKIAGYLVFQTLQIFEDVFKTLLSLYYSITDDLLFQTLQRLEDVKWYKMFIFFLCISRRPSGINIFTTRRKKVDT